jgi:hypothetical protein
VNSFETGAVVLGGLLALGARLSGPIPRSPPASTRLRPTLHKIVMGIAEIVTAA